MDDQHEEGQLIEWTGPVRDCEPAHGMACITYDGAEVVALGRYELFSPSDAA